MPTTPALRLLFAEYTHLARLDPGDLTDDQARSLRYLAIEQAIMIGDEPADPSIRMRNWILTVRRRDEFATREGRLPRENNRIAISDEEQSLADWGRYQRRPATRAILCAYQERRLLISAEFEWSPLDQAWERQHERYEVFTVDHRRAPRARTDEERPMAAWADKQRYLYRRGRLPQDRVDRLNKLSIWTWGRSGRADP